MHFLTVAVVCVVLATSVEAQAPNEENESAVDPSAVEARAFFERGSELARQRRFSEAAQAYERSLQLVNRSATRFNLGLCFYALGRHVESVELFEHYLDTADPAEEGSSIDEAREMLTHSRRQIAEFVIEVLPAEATVTVDGEPVSGAGTRQLRLNPGTHIVRAEADGHAPILLEVPIAAGESIRRALTLERESGALVRPSTLEVQASPNATIQIDGEVAGMGTATRELPAGTYRVEVLSESLAPTVADLELAEGQRFVWRIDNQLVDRPAKSRAGLIWGIVGGIAGAIIIGSVATVLARREPDPSGGSSGVTLTVMDGSGGVIIRP